VFSNNLAQYSIGAKSTSNDPGADFPQQILLGLNLPHWTIELIHPEIIENTENARTSPSFEFELADFLFPVVFSSCWFSPAPDDNRLSLPLLELAIYSSLEVTPVETFYALSR
jgi:hypothetical protein